MMMHLMWNETELIEIRRGTLTLQSFFFFYLEEIRITITIELPEKKAFHINDHVSYFDLYVQVTPFALISSHCKGGNLASVQFSVCSW